MRRTLEVRRIYLRLFVGSLKVFDDDFVHFVQSLGDSIRLRSVLVLQHLAQDSRDDLPRHSIFIIKPAALIFLSTLGKLLPQLVNLSLGLAIDEEGDSG